MISKAALNNLYRVYTAATATLRGAGKDGAAERLFEDFGHELSAVDSWYDDGQDPHQVPTYAPTMGDLNYYLKPHGLKGIGGKNPRIISL